MNVSAKGYAQALRISDPPRPTLHFNTLRKIGDPSWQPTLPVLRDLEEVILRNPIPIDGIPKRSIRSYPPRRSSRQPTAYQPSTC